MCRKISLAAAVVFAMLQGCATAPPSAQTASPMTGSTMTGSEAVPVQPGVSPKGSNPGASVTVAHVTEVPVETNAPDVEGHPLTSVVVTQCNLIVAVYMTMPDGRLLRFDRSASVPPDELMSMAYSATRSERVEVSCNDAGAAGYEKHDPV
jgi:hypothetical protein